MYPLYLHDLPGHYGLFAGHMPNRHGIFKDSPRYQTLQDQYDVQNIWWEKPGALFPYLIIADDIPAGFALNAAPPFCSQSTDFFVNDFFLMQPFRGNGIAEYAITKVFESYRGNWELYTNPSEKNVIGQKFWRRTVSNYAKGKYEEMLGSTIDGCKLIFRFAR
jgi:predicted acetyltransferase